MTTMEEIRELSERAQTIEQVKAGLEWANGKIRNWDEYYQELVGCWFLLRAYVLERSVSQC